MANITETYITHTIVKNINKYIKNSKIRQQWIADALNISKMNLSNILTLSKKNIDMDTLVSIANVLDLNFDDLKNINYEPESLLDTEERDMEPEYIALCEKILNEETKKTIGVVKELIDLVEVFKEANNYDLHFSSF
jgi:predicted XRE-type DNA-binding protein